MAVIPAEICLQLSRTIELDADVEDDVAADVEDEVDADVEDDVDADVKDVDAGADGVEDAALGDRLQEEIERRADVILRQSEIRRTSSVQKRGRGEAEKEAVRKLSQYHVCFGADKFIV